MAPSSTARSASRPLVGVRHRHGAHRRRDRRGERPRQNAAPARARHRAALRLARGAAALAAAARRRSPLSRSSARRRRCCFGEGLEAGFVSMARTAARRGARIAAAARRCAAARRDARARPARQMVLRRCAAAASRPLAGADGAAARALDQYRRRLDGRGFSSHIRAMARPAPRRRNLFRGGERDADARRSRHGSPRARTSPPFCRCARRERLRARSILARQFLARRDRRRAAARDLQRAFPAARRARRRLERVARGDERADQRAARAASSPRARLRRSTYRRRQDNWRVEIVGIYPDYGAAKGQMRVDHDALSARWPDARRLDYIAARAPEDAPRDHARSADAIRRRRRAHHRSGGAEATLDDIFERTFAVTAALDALTLVVSAIALFASLTTLAAARVAQLAPLWAVGVSRRSLAWLELRARHAVCGGDGARLRAARPRSRL